MTRSVFDWMLGVAPIPREAPDLAFNEWFRVVTWLWVPTQLALLAWLVRTVPIANLTAPELIAAAVSAGAITGAIGITFAHEMIHRRRPYERLLGNILLLSVTYPHFANEQRQRAPSRCRPRHSDHHLTVAKRYQALELLPHAPRLPAGYGAMFLLAFVPPLWFRVMNPRVAAARGTSLI